MPYVNDAQDIADRVKRVIRVRAGVDLSEVIDAALMLIVGLAEPAGYTQFEMSKLHIYLSAHLYEVDYQRKFEQEIGKSREKPETKVDLGLNLTRPGQQVLVLDYKRAFAPIDPENAALRKPRMFWAGNPREAH
jgi:hypothetical protein